jgi:erythrocyte band 7 integral membrane protein
MAHLSTTTDGSLSKAPLPQNGLDTSNSSPGAGRLIRVEPPRREDLQPTYATTLTQEEQDAGSHGWYGGMINNLGSIIGTCGAIPCCFICPNPYKPVQQGSVGLVTKFGRFTRAVDPGLVKVNPLSERLVAIDVKMQIVGMYLMI